MIKILMEEIYEIIDMLDSGVSKFEILEKLETCDKYKYKYYLSEIIFIQKKNKLYFTKLFETVEELVNDGLTKEEISLELDILKDLNKDIKNKIIDNISIKQHNVLDTDTDTTMISVD